MEPDWEQYIRIADRYQHKARHEDREDLRQDIILRLAEVAKKNGHKPYTEGGMIRVASYVVKEYWHGQKRNSRVTSLNAETTDGDGDSTELIDTIADDSALDLEAWIDAKVWLLGCPQRLIRIAHKRVSGEALDWKDYKYLQRKRKQLKLVSR